MFDNPYAASLEARVFSATPVELVRMLFDAAVDSVQAARRHLANGDIMARSRSVTKAFNILAELYSSLDRQQGGELSPRLASLYDYMQRRLLDANFRQTDDGLAEVEQLLMPLREAWSEIDTAQRQIGPTTHSTPQQPSSARYSLFDLEPVPASSQWSA